MKPGDIVHLLSGGPDMTVEGQSPYGIHCIWFVEGKIHRDIFKVEVLVLNQHLGPRIV
jgi:uncharacterized protein YodC (DUF2158 family)